MNVPQDPRAETAIEEMTRYVRFSAGEGGEVARLRPIVAPHLVRVAESFYERIREHEEAHAVLRDEAQVERLHASMVRWLGALFGGVYDAAHFAATERVGWVHVKIGLPQRYMHTAMTVIRQELHAILAEGGGFAHPTACTALDKLLDLELSVMVEAYRAHQASRLDALAGAPLAAASGLAARYLEAMERARVLVVGTDAQLAIRLFNREAERATGWARDEIEGRSVVELLFPEEHGPVIEQRLGSVVEEDDVFFDAVLVTRAGPTRSVRWQIARSATSGAGVVTFYFIGHDVTDEVALAERTRRAERLAAVGTLAAGLAHEIRNPLNGAHLHLTLLQRSLGRGDTPPEVLDSARTVAAEIQRLGHLVTDFLSFARPQPMRMVPTGLGELVLHVVQVLGPEAQRRGVLLATDLPRRNVGVLGDGPRIEQVLLNLVKNAVDAAERPASAAPPSGGQRSAGPRSAGHVAVRLRRTPTTAVIEVEDDGPGLPDPGAPIFDAFFTTKASGTGLGLSIAHRIIEDHGGTIQVESAPGRTVFRLVLPCAEGTFGENP
jgi:PAS domain S-box-containing protein